MKYVLYIPPKSDCSVRYSYIICLFNYTRGQSSLSRATVYIDLDDARYHSLPLLLAGRRAAVAHNSVVASISLQHYSLSRDRRYSLFCLKADE